jgi:hypothetical protein
MSEVFSAFDWTCQFTADRLAQASDVESGTSDTEVGLLPFNHVDEDVFRRALDEPAFAIDAEPVCLLDAHQWIDRIPQKPALTADIGLLSGHQWQRYGKGRRAVSAARVVTMWQQRLHHSADTLEEYLLSHSEPPRDGGPRASQSSISTGMW